MPSRERLIVVAFWAGLALSLASWWKRDELPPLAGLDPSLRWEPRQSETAAAPFEAAVGDLTYRVKPVYDYELWGLVVSMHDSATWWDRAHGDWQDRLNVTDLCVVWGNNAQTDAYLRASYSSSQYACWFAYAVHPGEPSFDPAALSNNHLLSTDPSIVSAIRSVRVGDQVHFRGKLAEYEHDHGIRFHRGTSTTRGDTGDHACETVYVDDFEVVKRGGGPWRALFWLGVAATLGAVVAWFAVPRAASN